MNSSRPTPPDFQAIFESAPGSNLILEPDSPRFSIVGVSDAYLAATMTKREHILGRGLFEVFPGNPADSEATGVRNLNASLDRVLATRTADAMAVQKYDIRRPDEQGGGFAERWWKPINSPVFGPNAQIAYIILRVEDVTELMRLQQAGAAHKKLSDELWETFVEQAPEGIFVADLDGRYTDVNAAGCRMLGYEREELIGKNILDIIPADSQGRLDREKEQLAGGAQVVSEWTLLKKDGGLLPVEVSAKILPDGRWQGFVRDISERKHQADLARRAREQLLESEERFRLTFDSAPIGMALVALDGTFVRVNRALCEIVGYAAEELTGKTFQEITHPEDLDIDLGLADRLLRGEIPRYQLAKRYVRKDGTLVDVMLSGSVMRNECGEPLYFIAQVEDITDRKQREEERRRAKERLEHALALRKQAEEALRHAEALSSGIISISMDAIISIDEAQRITRFNDGAEKIFGYSRAEVIGAPLDILIPERFRAIHRLHVERFATGEDDARRVNGRGAAQVFGRRKDGEEFPADAGISRFEAGGERILTVVLRDITEQKRIESEQRFLAEVGPVLATSLEYEDTLSKIAELAVRELADLCIVDIVGEDGEVRRLKVLAREPDRAWIAEALLRVELDRKRAHLVSAVLETKKPVFIERVTPDLVASWAQGDEHLRVLRGLDPKSMVAVPLLAHDKLLGVLALISSTRTYVPADLELAEELARRAALSIDNAQHYRTAKSAIQARDDILGIVAHDLRNPLNTIILQASLLRQCTASESRSSKPADKIERAATRMNRLIQDLLDVTRMEGDRLSLERACIPTRTFVSDVIEAQRPLADEASLTLQLDLAPDSPDVWADHDRLIQVFENLIGNALKFTEAPGCITVGAKPRDGEALFWVADTGPGIVAEDVPHLFDRFWQARKTGRTGAGLGLPIVKGIVEAHGGRVWVESTPGRGSTFFFTIPTAPRKDEGRGESAPGGA